jgi:hypothetical protein
MSRQSKKSSLIESSLNVVSGAAIAFMTTQLVGPLLGYHINPTSNLILTSILTVVSVIRGYFWRRCFENRMGRLG